MNGVIDTDTMGATIAIVKQIPGTAAQRAETAAAEAEASAQAAAMHNMGVAISGHKIIFQEVINNG